MVKGLAYFRCSLGMQARKVKSCTCPHVTTFVPQMSGSCVNLPRQEQNTDSNGGKGKWCSNISLRTWQEASAETCER